MVQRPTGAMVNRHTLENATDMDSRTTRRTFLKDCSTSAAAFSTLAETVFAAEPGRWSLSEAQLKRLSEALKPFHARYDADAAMLREPFHSIGYHSTLKGGTVHPTRESLTYAVALLDTGEEPLRVRAEAILRRVIALQDQNPASKTFGIWSWFLEEPLAVMSPPDPNWADFCGVQLLQVAHDHRERLSPDLQRQVDTAIRHAAHAIQRRNVGPAYTNIAIMGAYVTLVAGELYGWHDLRAYGLDRLRRFYDYTRNQGAFSEYNSPTYTLVAGWELSRIKLHARDPAARRMAEELYRMAWEEIAEHFHVPTHQWAGPHSRNYRTLLGRDTLGHVERGLGDHVHFGAYVPTIFEQRLPFVCPDDMLHHFTTVGPARDLVKTYAKASPPVVGTTRLEPAFTLGSVNRGDLWNQRRSLVAYWGTATNPSSLQLRFLRDGYDFADAQFFSVQRGGDVLAAVNLGTDGGNTHISLDRLQAGMVRARDFRLRFEFDGGAGREAPSIPPRLTAPVRLSLDGVNLALTVPHAVFGAETPRWESGRQGTTAYLDVVLYQGPDREFRLNEIDHAALGLALRLTPGAAIPPMASAFVRDGRLALSWGPLRLSVPTRPDTTKALQGAVRSGVCVSGTPRLAYRSRTRSATPAGPAFSRLRDDLVESSIAKSGERAGSMPESSERIIQQAAEVIAGAEAILIGAGAGMGVDSGLPDFRGVQGFWRAYPPYARMNLGFAALANPRWFREDPALAWGFYGHRLGLYRRTRPHAGFALLRDWAERMPRGGFVYTSNVDGHFQRSGFDPDRVVEAHGSIHWMQCPVDCGVGIFPADSFEVEVDEETLRAIEPLPKCPHCGILARPNILMFGDSEWDPSRTEAQSAGFRRWLESLRGSRLVVVECGAGTAIATVRRVCEDLAHRFDGTLVRINPREPEVPAGHLSLPLGALEAIQAINGWSASQGAILSETPPRNKWPCPPPRRA